MCETISSKFLIAHLLKRQEEVSVEDLKRLRRKIERDFPSVLVDISYGSVSSAVAEYPSLFAWQGDSIARAEGSEYKFLHEPDYIDREFGWNIPAPLRKKLLAYIAQHSAMRISSWQGI